MTKQEIVKMLRTETEIVSLDPASHGLIAALALERLYAGKQVNAKLVAGPWKRQKEIGRVP
jgi:hypothetical protein